MVELQLTYYSQNLLLHDNYVARFCNGQEKIFLGQEGFIFE